MTYFRVGSPNKRDKVSVMYGFMQHMGTHFRLHIIACRDPINVLPIIISIQVESSKTEYMSRGYRRKSELIVIHVQKRDAVIAMARKEKRRQAHPSRAENRHVLSFSESARWHWGWGAEGTDTGMTMALNEAN